MDYRRCAFCRQMIDPENPEELVHHARMRHKPMPGIPDDGLETIEMDFRAAQHQSWVEEARHDRAQAPAPYRNARKGRRRRSDFK